VALKNYEVIVNREEITVRGVIVAAHLDAVAEAVCLPHLVAAGSAHIRKQSLLVSRQINEAGFEGNVAGGKSTRRKARGHLTHVNDFVHSEVIDEPVDL